MKWKKEIKETETAVETPYSNLIRKRYIPKIIGITVPYDNYFIRNSQVTGWEVYMKESGEKR